MLSKEQKDLLLSLARQSIEQRFNQPAPKLPRDVFLRQKMGVFVSLHKAGELRGCIGYIKGYKPLGESIIEMAQAAAFTDPRFPPMRMEELKALRIEISILGDLLPIDSVDEIVIGRDGLYIDHPHGSGLLLPQVAVEWGWDLPTYLQQLCRKAGIASGAWKDKETSLQRFEAEVFGEAD